VVEPTLRLLTRRWCSHFHKFILIFNIHYYLLVDDVAVDNKINLVDLLVSSFGGAHRGRVVCVHSDERTCVCAHLHSYCVIRKIKYRVVFLSSAI
jgi:hypothetical protein